MIKYLLVFITYIRRKFNRIVWERLVISNVLFTFLASQVTTNRWTINEVSILHTQKQPLENHLMCDDEIVLSLIALNTKQTSQTKNISLLTWITLNTEIYPWSEAIGWYIDTIMFLIFPNLLITDSTDVFMIWVTGA